MWEVTVREGRVGVAVVVVALGQVDIEAEQGQKSAGWIHSVCPGANRTEYTEEQLRELAEMHHRERVHERTGPPVEQDVVAGESKGLLVEPVETGPTLLGPWNHPEVGLSAVAVVAVVVAVGVVEVVEVAEVAEVAEVVAVVVAAVAVAVAVAVEVEESDQGQRKEREKLEKKLEKKL